MNKSAGWAYLLWLPCLVGVCGLHRFYLGRPATGALWLFTLGLLGIGQLVDLFLINRMIEEDDEDARLQAALVKALRSYRPARS